MANAGYWERERVVELATAAARNFAGEPGVCAGGDCSAQLRRRHERHGTGSHRAPGGRSSPGAEGEETPRSSLGRAVAVSGSCRRRRRRRRHHRRPLLLLLVKRRCAGLRAGSGRVNVWTCGRGAPDANPSTLTHRWRWRSHRHRHRHRRKTQVVLTKVPLCFFPLVFHVSCPAGLLPPVSCFLPAI